MIYNLQLAGLDYVGDTVSAPGGQSWTREVTVTWAGHKIRARVERDSYDFQSRIYSEVFSPAELKWNRVQTLPGADHKDLVSGYERDHDKIYASSERLVEQLLAYAQQILEGVTA
jgi:hypothetical protein